MKHHARPACSALVLLVLVPLAVSTPAYPGTTTTTITTTTSTLGECGNNLVEGAEECDNGLANSDTTPDACRSTCMLPFCSDAVTDTGEQCDDGNPVSGEGCDVNCTVTACGNGVQTGSEQCDDGNLVDGDGCTAACEVQIFGDGVTQAGEQCDDAGNSAGCDADCTAPSCGDGTLNTAAGEECEDGNSVENDDCDNLCRFRGCSFSIATDRAVTAIAENVWGSAWSPDGKRIAFSRQGPGAAPTGDLWVVDAKAPLSPPLLLATGGTGTVFNIAWSPDGSHVFFAGGCGIQRVPSDGSVAPENVVFTGTDPNISYTTSRLFYSSSYTSIRSFAVDVSGAPLPGTDRVVAGPLPSYVVQPTTAGDDDSLLFGRFGTGPNLASRVYRLTGVLAILSGATTPPVSLSDARISVVADRGTFVNTPTLSLNGKLTYLVEGNLGPANILGNNFSGAEFPGEDIGTDDQPLDPGEDLGFDGALLDSFDNGSGVASMVSDNDGVTMEPSIGEGNGILDAAPATTCGTIVARVDGLGRPTRLAGGFGIGLSPDGTRISFLRRTWEGLLGTSKAFLNGDLFIASVRAT